MIQVGMAQALLWRLCGRWLRPLGRNPDCHRSQRTSSIYERAQLFDGSDGERCRFRRNEVRLWRRVGQIQPGEEFESLTGGDQFDDLLPVNLKAHDLWAP